MKEFLDENFLLTNPVAEALYHSVARGLPIVDYHNHLSPKDIFENRTYNNLTEIWLEDDHYKWRALRANGVAEKYITGDASPEEKFKMWAKTVPYTLRNPLYHWTHMELKNPFQINTLLNEDSASMIYAFCNEQLQGSPAFKAQGLLKHWKVTDLNTTDDPVDDLKYHIGIKELKGFDIRVNPTFRADNLLRISEHSFFESYLSNLGEASDVSIDNWIDFKEAILRRHDFFASNGCKMFDVSMPYAHSALYTDSEIKSIFEKGIRKKELNPEEIEKYKSAVLQYLCELNHTKNWVQQFHIGPLRNNNTNLITKVGADAGADSMDDQPQARRLSIFFDNLKTKDALARTIIYNLNPNDNAIFASMIANFNDDSEPGKLQLGAAWWFLDQKEGIISNLNTNSNYGLLRRFVGMLTDSRSLLSFSRHEYFRRILCELIGKDVINGEIPYDFELLKAMISDICYNNSKRLIE